MFARDRRLGSFLLVPVCLVAAIAAACAPVEQPEAYSPTTLVADDDGPGVTDEDATNSQTRVERPFDLFVPTAEANDVAALLVATPEFPFSVIGTDSFTVSTPVAESNPVLIVDDFGGGLVIERSDGTVAHYQSSGEVVELASEAPLLDVGYWDGSPMAFVLAAPNQVDWIRLAAQDPNEPRERQTHILLDQSDEIISFSAGGYLQAVVVDDGACGRLQFFDPTGERSDLSGPNPPACTFRGRPVFSSVAVSPLSDAVAVAAVTYRADGTEGATDLLVSRLEGDASPFTSRRIGEDLDSISSLTYDGTRVGYIRTSAQSESGAEAPQISVGIINLAVPINELSVDLLGASSVSSVAFARIGVDGFS